jgi:hypothetical protein
MVESVALDIVRLSPGRVKRLRLRLGRS